MSKRITIWSLIILLTLSAIYLADWLTAPAINESESMSAVAAENTNSPQTATVVPLATPTLAEPESKPTHKTVSRSTVTATVTSVETQTVHIIAAGDTLLAVAETYKISLAALLAANPNLEPTLLQIGQKVILPQGAEDYATVPTVTSIVLPTSTATAITVASDGVAILEQGMLDAVNAERVALGLQAFVVDDELVAVARAHAQDMVTRGYFDHVTPEGITLRDRLKRAGIEKYWVGENIQSNTHPLDQSVEITLAWFMESEPHRNNILAEAYTRLGVGVVEGSPGWYTYVLVFAGES